MKQIVPEQIWEKIVRNYGGEAVTDINLYNEIFQKQFLNENPPSIHRLS